MLFAPASFSFVRGTQWHDEVTLTDARSDAPVNLTGVTRIVMRIREFTDGPIVVELSTTAGTLVVLDAAGGVIGIRVGSTLSRSFPEADHRKAKYVYDAVIERSGEFEPAIAGKITVLPQLTRPWANT